MLNVFAADASDLQWIYRLLINASARGHFNIVNTRSGREWQKQNIHSIVHNNRRIDADLQVQTLVFENDAGKVGFVIMSEVEKGYGNEIYSFIVDKEFRGRGYGRYMLNEIIERWHSDVTIYARCFPPSLLMASMLRKSGFVCEGVSEFNAEIYRLDKKQENGYLL